MAVLFQGAGSNNDATNKWVPNMTGLKEAIEDAEFEVLDSHIGGARGSVKARAIADKQTALLPIP